MYNLDLTLTVFYFILLVMVIFTASYWYVTSSLLEKIERRSIFMDIRFWIPCLVYTILLGFRWDYSFDWDQYYNTFINIQKGILYRDSTEKGYLTINYLLGQLGFNFYSIFLLEGFLYITSIYIMLQKNRKALLFALPLIYISARNNCLNISRQFFAQSFLWIAFYYLIQGKRTIYFILGAVACSIHTSAFFWIVAFYLIKFFKIPSLKVTTIIYLGCLVFQVLFQKYFYALSTVLITYMLTDRGYDSDYMMADRFHRIEFSLFHTLLYAFIDFTFILSVYFVKKRGLVKSKWEEILMIVGIYGVCLNVVGGTHEIFSRFFWYFSYLYYIAWGIVLCYMCKNIKQVPFYLWIFTAISLMQKLWSMYALIIAECTGPDHHYLEYRLF